MAVTWLISPPEGLAEPVAIAHSEVETFTKDEWTASVVLECPWNSRWAIRANILNNRIEWPYQVGSRLWATSASVVPTPNVRTQQDGSGNTYLTARITVNFQRLPDDREENEGGPGGGTTGGSNVLFTESIDLNGEMLKLAPELFEWPVATNDFTTAGKKIKADEAPSKILLGFDYVVQYTGLETIPEEAITYIDCVNEETFTSPSLGFEFGKETLLFNPPKINRKVTNVAAENLFDMQCRWSWRKNGWNWFYRAETESYYPMMKAIKGDGVGGSTIRSQFKPFALVDMTDMLP